MQLETNLNLVHLDRDILDVVPVRDPKMYLWSRGPQTAAFMKRYLLTFHLETRHRSPRFVCHLCHEGFAKLGALASDSMGANCRARQQSPTAAAGPAASTGDAAPEAATATTAAGEESSASPWQKLLPPQLPQH